jgi:hypothetical protein
MALLMCAHGAALLPESLGVITPYRAQANLIKDLLIECSLGESVTVGTVHKYQGGERDTIILDLTESEPHSLGSFLSATSFADTGARLLNVALSRAKRHLIVLGNIEFLRQRLPSGAILSGVLDDILKVSHKLSVQELVNQPVFNTPSLEVRSSAEVLAFQSFGIEEFTPALVSELLEARSEVILISPTVSRQCADVFGVVLQGRVKAGVKVSVHTQLGQQADYEQQSAVLALKRAGIVIKPYTAGQPLCVVIDSEVVWLGSIPPLDSIGKATGEMTRSVSARAALFVLSCCEELANEQHEAVAVARFSY